MYIRPLAFDYRSDINCRDIEDQLLVGDSIMIAPVYEQNAKGRFVYLPEKMKFVRFRSVDDYDVEMLNKGNHHIDLSLNEVAVFIRPGHRLPMAIPAKRVGEIDFENLKYLEG